MKKLLICFLAITLISCLDEPRKRNQTPNTNNIPIMLDENNVYEKKEKEDEISKLKTEIENLLKNNINNGNSKIRLDAFENVLYIDDTAYPLDDIDIWYYFSNYNPDYGSHFIMFACKNNLSCLHKNFIHHKSLSSPIKNEKVVLEFEEKISKLLSLK